MLKKDIVQIAEINMTDKIVLLFFSVDILCWF